ncbi:MAG: sulfate adenylyltransferase subunit 1 [Nitritalea sp.]
MQEVKKLITIATAGSVDDGKSTLIGRLLYETNSLPTDKLEAIERSSKQKGYDYLDFSLATDGLIAEREQGITIDVAHIYFNTERTNYIIADTPGHVEYTRNMVTGASKAQVAIILIDARKGVLEQTYRHFFISDLLQMRHVIIAINKMDLVAYDEEVFERIRGEMEALVAKSNFSPEQVHYLPVSALQGDNITVRSERMPWYQGNALLPHLEVLEEAELQQSGTEARFPVQYVIRPKTASHPDFRGFAGTVYGGTFSVGQEICVLPSLKTSRIVAIHQYTTQVQTAEAGMAPVLVLADDIDISRGDMIVPLQDRPQSVKEVSATICQLNSQPLRVGQRLVLQHGVNRVHAKVTEIEGRIPTDFGPSEAADTLALNEIGQVRFKLSKPIHVDAFTHNRHTGSFILIDEQGHDTLSVGFVQ